MARTARGGAFILAVVLAASAEAADKIEAPPAEKWAISSGGVDMRTGEYAFSQTDVSIGDGDGGLALTRGLKQDAIGHINPFSNFSHNWDVMITERRFDMSTGDPMQPGLDFQMSVRFGGRSETFQGTRTAAEFNQVSRGNFARLTFSGLPDDKASSSVTYTYETADGTLVVFRPMGQSDCGGTFRCAFAQYIINPDGTRFDLDYQVNSSASANKARLRSVKSSRGYALLLESGSGTDWNLVTKACVLNLAYRLMPSTNLCPADAPSASYTYTTMAGKRWLATATDAGGGQHGYGYVDQGNGDYSMAFTKPGQSAPWLTNSVWTRMNGEGGTDEAIIAQSFAEGTGIGYSYDEAPLIPGQPQQYIGGSYTQGNRTTVVQFGFPIKPGSKFGTLQTANSEGEESTITFQVTPGPVKIVDPEGHVTTYDYCDPHAMTTLPASEHHRCQVVLLQGFKDPEGRETRLTYAGYRSVGTVTRYPGPDPSGSLSPIVTSTSYQSCAGNLKRCTKPHQVTDARNNVTTYENSPDHGGLLTETGPLVGGVQPQTRYKWEPRQAYILTVAGNPATYAANPAVYVLTAKSMCRISAPTGNAAAPCATAGDEVLTTYDYGPASGPNNLLLRGMAVTADGVTLRTCYGYDQRGRRISETQPAANVAVCP